jgi:endonuclease/exonuclease/phosphatase family metal-dependent hydrolase
MRLGVGCAVVTMAFVGACSPLDPFHTSFQGVEDAVYYESAVKKAAPDWLTSLRVMTYNIKFAGARLSFFFECDGDRGLMTEYEVVGNLRGLADAINEIAPDVLLLQEVDVESKRCAYVDGVQWLLDHTALNYGVYASQWKADYVPSDGIGRVDSGNAVLSRWPIVGAERLALALSAEETALTRYFYLKRNILRARIPLPGAKELSVLNMHAEAFSKDDIRVEHIKTFAEVMGEIDAAGGWGVGGGDFNTIPPRSDRVKGFADDCRTDARFANDDYTGEEHYLDDLYALFDEAIPIADYLADNRPYFSFTGNAKTGWNRRLDYLFTNERFEPGSGVVHQSADQGGVDTLELSDHAPVSVRLEVQR